MASGTGEWQGNWMKASNSGAYRFVKVDSTSFNESTGVTTVNWHVGTYVSYGNFYGSNVSSWGSCTHSYALYDCAIYDCHYATTTVSYNSYIHFVEGCGYTSSSAGGWIQSALDVYWYPTLPTYAVSYNANGGSGAPSAQTKTWGTTLKLSSTAPTRTGYTFGGWNTKADGTGTTYPAGGNYTANAKVTLYAKWTIITYPVNYANGGHGTAPATQTKTYGTALTLRPGMGTVSNYKFKDWKATNGTTYSGGGSYTANATTTMTAEWYAPYSVTYDANGGSGAPSSQVKVYGGSVNISSTVPTRTNYNFIEWNTNASGTGTKYTAGQAYSTNANLALYAIWEIAHSNPTISNLLVQRCLQDGTLADDGEYCKVTATVSVDNSTEGYTDTKLKTVTVQVGSNDAESVTVDTTATSASISFISANQLSLTSAYSVKLTVTDSHDFSSYRTSNLSIAYFTMHFKEGGHGIAIGKKSVTDNLFDVNMDTSINGVIHSDGNVYIDNKTKGYYVIDQADVTYPAVYDNGTNLWVGAESGAGPHHTGALCLSTGYTGTGGNKTFSACVPNADNTGGTFYDVFHTGYLDVSKATNGNLPISHGGTGAADRVAALRGLTFLGTNPTGGASNDTREWWAARSPCIAYFSSTGQLNNQPAQWGFVISLCNGGAEVHQIWFTQANGKMLHRGGNGATTAMGTWYSPHTADSLYYNATGTNGTVTLSASAANYNHMRIYFKKNGDTNSCSSTDLYLPNGKKAVLIIGNVSSSTAQLTWKIVTVSGTSITVSSQIYWNRDMSSGSMTGSTTDSNIYIYRVEAWYEWN